MSLEAKIEALTTALEENTAALKAAGTTAPKTKPANDDVPEERSSRRSRRDADEGDSGSTRSRRDRDVDADKGEGDKEERRSSRRSRDADEDADKGETRRSRRANGADKETKADKKKKATFADVRAAFASFVENEDLGLSEAKREDFIDSILDHLDVDKTSEIEEADFDKVIGWVKAKTDAPKKEVEFD